MWKKHADSDIQRRGRALPFDLYFIHKLCSQVIPIKLYYSCWLCVICYNLYCSTCVFCSGSPSIVLSCPRIDFSFVTKHSDLVREARTGGAGD